jgi:septal ring factor EnvC (AmiA/AmiB activator)
VASLQATLQDQTARLDDLQNDRDAMRQHQLRHDDRGTRLASQLASLEQENAALSAKLLASHHDRNQLQSKLDALQVRAEHPTPLHKQAPDTLCAAVNQTSSD